MVSKTVKTVAALAGIGVAGVAGYFAYQRYGFGDIELATAPSGIDVAVDGGLAGPSPLKGRLPIGRHTLTVPATITVAGQTLNLLWDDGTTNPTRIVNIIATEAGSVFGNLFLATYSTGSGGQILGSISSSPSIIQDTQYFSVGAHVTEITGHPLFGCQWKVGAFSKWTGSDFTTRISPTNLLSDANGTIEISTQPLPLLITVFDTTGQPMAGVTVAIWTDPQILSPLDNRPLFKMLAVSLAEPGSGTASDPYLRTTDQNGQAVIALTPATYINNARLLLCSDQVVSNDLPQQTDESPGLCPNIGDGSAMGSGCSNCTPDIGCSKTGFCCTRNNQAVTSPVQGTALATIHVRAVGTLKEAQVTLTMQAQIRL